MIHLTPKNPRKMFFRSFLGQLEGLGTLLQQAPALHLSKLSLPPWHLLICCSKELSPAQSFDPIKAFKDYEITSLLSPSPLVKFIVCSTDAKALPEHFKVILAGHGG